MFLWPKNKTDAGWLAKQRARRAKWLVGFLGLGSYFLRKDIEALRRKVLSDDIVRRTIKELKRKK